MSGRDPIFDDYEIRREWWFPFVVTVWMRTSIRNQHWTRGEYIVQMKKGDFFRRKTAERYVEWLAGQRDPLRATDPFLP